MGQQIPVMGHGAEAILVWGECYPGGPIDRGMTETI